MFEFQIPSPFPEIGKRFSHLFTSRKDREGVVAQPKTLSSIADEREGTDKKSNVLFLDLEEVQRRLEKDKQTSLTFVRLLDNRIIFGQPGFTHQKTLSQLKGYEGKGIIDGGIARFFKIKESAQSDQLPYKTGVYFTGFSSRLSTANSSAEIAQLEPEKIEEAHLQTSELFSTEHPDIFAANTHKGRLGDITEAGDVTVADALKKSA